MNIDKKKPREELSQDQSAVVEWKFMIAWLTSNIANLNGRKL
jgi:hypothetical protein